MEASNETVWISALIEKRFPETFTEIIGSLVGHNISCELLSSTKDIWCRDYMPVMAVDKQLVLFKYEPSYLMASESGEKTIPDQEELCKDLNLKHRTSNIILDGGAIEISGSTGIVSDRLFRDNFKVWKNKERDLLEKLKDDLQLKKLLVVPQYPYDFTGHVDGLVRLIDEKTVLINDLMPEFEEMLKDTNQYRKKLIEQWYYSFKMAIHNVDLECEELVCMIDVTKKDSNAYGIYLNFLLLDNLILVPGFNHENDEVARKKLERLYKRKAVTVQAIELAEKGGIINCVTWTNSN